MRCVVFSVIGLIAAMSSAAAQAQVATAVGESARDDTPLLSILSLVPEKDRTCFMIRGAKNLTGREAETLNKISAAHPVIISNALPQIPSMFGIKADEVETLVVTMVAKEGFVVLSLTSADAARRFVAKTVPGAIGTRVGDRELFANEADNVAAIIFDGRHVLTGTVATLKTAFETKAPKPSETVRRFLADASKASLLTIDIAPKPFGISNDPVTINSPVGPLSKAERWCLTVDTSRDLKLSFKAEFAEAGTAQAAAEAFPKITALLSGYVAMADEKMPPVFERDLKNYPRGPEAIPFFKQAMADTKKGLEKPAVSVVGNNLEATITIATERPLTTAVMLITLGPRPARTQDEKP